MGSKSKFSMRRMPAVCVALLTGIGILAACTTEDALRPKVSVGPSTARVMPAVSSQGSLFGFPAPDRLETPVMPEEEIACRRKLDRLGVTYTDLPAINDGGGCGIAFPVRVSRLPGGVELTPAATLNCGMAETFARWTKNELTPAARRRYFSGIRTIRQGSSYSCRTIGNRRGGKLSEHAKGNALDIMDVTLKNGKEIDVRKPGLFAFRQRGLLNSVRGDACDYFSTVLGPGYDRDHKDHFHFDLMDRRSGYKACR